MQFLSLSDSDDGLLTEISRFNIFLTFHIFGLSRIRLNQYSLNFNRYNTQQLEKQRWNLVVLGQCSALISKIIFVFQCKRPFSCYISAKTRKKGGIFDGSSLIRFES